MIRRKPRDKEKVDALVKVVKCLIKKYIKFKDGKMEVDPSW